jgi:hypothetical protein
MCCMLVIYVYDTLLVLVQLLNSETEFLLNSYNAGSCLIDLSNDINCDKIMQSNGLSLMSICSTHCDSLVKVFSFNSFVLIYVGYSTKTKLKKDSIYFVKQEAVFNYTIYNRFCIISFYVRNAKI